MIAFFRNPSLRSSATTSAKAVQPLTPYGRYSARTSRPTNLCILFIRSGLAEIAQARVPSSFRHGFCPRYRPCFLGIPPRRTLKHNTPSSAPPFFQIHKSHGIGYGMNSVGTPASKKLGVIPSADQVNNTVSVPLVLDVKRYFKPLWKPGTCLTII